MKCQSALLAASILSLFLAACGDKPSTEPAAPATAPAAPGAPAAPAATEAVAPATAPATAVASADPALGQSVYKKTCTACHGAGIAGAPKTGDKDTWAPRIAQGKDTLYKHAIEGFTGTKGMMPARGGFSSLSDDDVKAAVDYMADQAM